MVKMVRIVTWRKKHSHSMIKYKDGSQAPIDYGSDWDPTG